MGYLVRERRKWSQKGDRRPVRGGPVIGGRSHVETRRQTFFRAEALFRKYKAATGVTGAERDQRESPNQQSFPLYHILAANIYINEFWN
jgi:hypothetical protein